VASHNELAEVQGVQGTPSTFHADLWPGDWAAIQKRLKAYPGVLDVTIHREWFSAGVADVTVLLCWPMTAEDRRKLGEYVRMDKVCVGRGPATPPEKTEILARLRAMPQVDRIYFDSTAHAREAFRMTFRAAPSMALPEAFYVVLNSKAGVADVERALRGMEAVVSVTPA
jgi:cell division protein FtsX